MFRNRQRNGSADCTNCCRDGTCVNIERLVFSSGYAEKASRKSLSKTEAKDDL